MGGTVHTWDDAILDLQVDRLHGGRNALQYGMQGLGAGHNGGVQRLEILLGQGRSVELPARCEQAAGGDGDLQELGHRDGLVRLVRECHHPFVGEDDEQRGYA